MKTSGGSPQGAAGWAQVCISLHQQQEGRGRSGRGWALGGYAGLSQQACTGEENPLAKGSYVCCHTCGKVGQFPALGDMCTGPSSS